MQATINGVKIGYDDFGQGPAVLFVHDYPLNRQMWQQQVEPVVAAGFRVILTDLRGFGESELNTDPVEIGTWSADIVGLLDYLGIGRAAVCGLSLGGYVLFDLMENYPQRIVGACLASCRPVADDIHERARRGEQRAALNNQQLATVKEEIYDMLLANQDGSLPEPARKAVRNWIQDLQGEALQVAIQAIGKRKDYTFLLKSLHIPTLLIGADQDPITHHKHTEIMAQQLPNLYKAVTLNSGHLVNMEKAAEFNACLLDFLHNLPPKQAQQPIEALRNVI